MRSSYQTCLSLLEWQEWIALHPWYFSQIDREADGTPFPARSKGDCEKAFFQFGWQNSDFLSREDVGRAIWTAEHLFNSICHYWPAPRYLVGETHLYPQNGRLDTYPWWGDQRGQFRTVQANNYYLQAFGLETLTLVNATVSLAGAYSDTDGDGVAETVQFTVNVPAGTLASEVAVFFNATDRLGKPLNEMEIRPLSVSISVPTATIRGYAYQFVKPIYQLPVNPTELAHNTAGNFAASVSVYRRTTDPTSSGSLIWETPNDQDAPCTLAVTAAGFGVRDSVRGYVTPQPASYSAGAYTALDPAVSWRAPDRVSMNYLSGFPRRDDGRMDDLHRDIICYIATAKLPRRTCGCQSSQQRILDLQTVPSSNERAFVLSTVQFDVSPLLGTRGELEASLLINNLPVLAGGMISG